MPPTLDEDTIEVKANDGCEYPSSPDSEIETFDDENKVPLHEKITSLESPEPIEADLPSRRASTLHPTSLNSNHISNKRPPLFVATMEQRLQAMLEKRPLPWREGVEPGAEIETGGESRRKQIRFGCLLATRGDVQDHPCNSCARGSGKVSF